jgi:hypothetical protein
LGQDRTGLNLEKKKKNTKQNKKDIAQDERNKKH